MDIGGIGSSVTANLRRSEEKPASQVVSPSLWKSVRYEDMDPETQATWRKMEDDLRKGPLWQASQWSRREFSDSAIKDAIGKADMTKMDDDQIEAQIEVFSFVMQSGREQDFSIVGKNGDQTTTSMSQYLSWLAQRRAEMKDDGTYSPAIASTW